MGYAVVEIETDCVPKIHAFELLVMIVLLIGKFLLVSISIFITWAVNFLSLKLKYFQRLNVSNLYFEAHSASSISVTIGNPCKLNEVFNNTAPGSDFKTLQNFMEFGVASTMNYLGSRRLVFRCKAPVISCRKASLKPLNPTSYIEICGR